MLIVKTEAMAGSYGGEESGIHHDGMTDNWMEDQVGTGFSLGHPSLEEHNHTGYNPQILDEEECFSLYWNLSIVPLNITCLGHAPTLNQAKLIRAFILMAMAIFSFAGNGATMISIRKSKMHRSIHVYTLIYHLSIADLWVTFWCILGEAMWFLTVEWKAGNWACKAFKFSQMFGLYLSTFIMVLIGVDRFIAVKYPLKSMRKGLCNRLVAACWGVSAVLSLPQIFVFHVVMGPFVEEFSQCVTYGTYTAEWQEHLYATFTILFMFIIPLVILATTYIRTFCTLRRNEEILDHSGSFRTLIDPNRRTLIRRAKMKSLRISVAIVTTFIICWTPYYVMMITVLFFIPNRHQILSDDMQSGIFFFGMSNSLFNPLIYGIFHLWKPRRKELQRGLSRRCTLVTNYSFDASRSSAGVGTILNVAITNNNRLGSTGTLADSVFTDGGGLLVPPLGGRGGGGRNHHYRHQLSVMSSRMGGGAHQLRSSQGTYSTSSSVCICANRNGSQVMEDVL